MAAPPIPHLELTVDDVLKRVDGRVTFDGSTLELDVYRVGPSGVPAYVRGVRDVDVSALTVYDFTDLEVPFGVPVDYVAVARNGDGEAASSQNRVINTGFESAVADGQWSGIGSTPVRSTTKKRSGDWSLRWASVGSSNDSVQAGIPDVFEGDVLEIEAWVNPDTTLVLNVQVNELDSVGSLNVFSEGPNVTCPAGVWTRLAYERTMSAGTFDAEVYFTTAGVQPSSLAYIDDVVIVTGPLSVQLDSDDDWLVDLDDARNTGPVLVESLSELTYTAPQGVHRIIGRRTPIVTSDIRWTPSGRLVLVTQTVDEARRVRDALGSSSPLLFRSTLERGVGNLYFVPGASVVEQRMSRLATEPARRWLVELIEIDRPDPSLYTPLTVTWGEVLSEFATWQELLDERADWGDVLINRDGFAGASVYSREPAFPPRDV